VPRAVVHHGPSQVDGGGSGGEVRCGGQGAESYRRYWPKSSSDEAR
jgi:hypothetical protein